MKKRILGAMIPALFCYVGVWGQNITIKAVTRPAEKVFTEIMRQSGKNFVYTSDLLEGLNISVNASDMPLKEVLDKMFSGTEIGFKIRGNNVLLFRKEKPTVRKVTISGFIREKGSEEALPGAIIKLDGSSVATSSNVMGFYSLSVPVGDIKIKVMFPGFEDYTTELIKLTSNKVVNIILTPDSRTLNEVVVHGSKNHTLTMESSSLGALNINKGVIAATPVIFGERDVIKTLQLEPGVSAGVEGLAGMYVHGGNADENLYMLDNIPLYQVNHFGGLFSAFNTEAIRNVDFYKSSFPARYDGRLSSYMDVNTKDGSMMEHHGSFRLGLTSGAFNIDGPIRKDHTSYSIALRRSWYDILTVPALAIANKFFSKDKKVSFGYAFSDINAKINHRFSERSSAYISFYYGDDYLKVGEDNKWNDPVNELDGSKNRLRWGNVMASAGWNYVLSSKLFGKLTGAFTQYKTKFSRYRYDKYYKDDIEVSYTNDHLVSDNFIKDWIIKTDFDWRPDEKHNIDFGLSYIRHKFQPTRSHRLLTYNDTQTGVAESFDSYRANEFNAYIGDNWGINSNIRLNFGVHFSMFNITGKTHTGLSPRVSLRLTPTDGWAIKAGYSRTTQYVHQLVQSAISLPTDQWIPIVNDQTPQVADQIAVGAYCSLLEGYTFSLEGYWKKLHNLLEYRDDYYMLPPDSFWADKMTVGKGSAKGLDFKVAKEIGKVNGHISYSLLWADRQFPDRNNGKKYPARFDNRHKINILIDWKVNDKWEISASWTGMSGNRITLGTQVWKDPELAPWNYDMLMPTDINNVSLPFYHRMDINFKRTTKRGYWDFSIYNAYCNMNTITIVRDYNFNYTNGFSREPVYKKIKLIPLIPSVAYTWIF